MHCKLLSVLFSIILILSLLSGCNNNTNTQPSNTLTIAVIQPSDDLDNAESQNIEGINNAINEIKSQGMKVQVSTYKCDMNYDSFVSVANTISQKPEINAVLLPNTSNEIANAVSQIMEEAKKPLFITSGADDDFLSKAYHYVYCLSLDAENQGANAAAYIKNNQYRIALIHSDTSFEKDESIGFEKALISSSSSVVDSISGPLLSTSISDIVNRWRSLGVTCCYISYEPSSNSETSAIVSLISELKAMNVQVIGDYHFVDILKTLSGDATSLKILDGVVVTQLYPYSNSKGDTMFSVMGYDFTKVLVSAYFNGAKQNTEDLYSTLHSNDGFSIGSYKIVVNDKGIFTGKTAEYAKISNGGLVTIK